VEIYPDGVAPQEACEVGVIRPFVGCRNRDGGNSHGVQGEASQVSFDEVINLAIGR
jgi:hypothetical protein